MELAKVATATTQFLPFLDPAEESALLAAAPVKSFARDQVVFEQNVSLRAIFLVDDGSVRVERQDPQTGGWAPIQTVGSACDAQDDVFLTDHAGFFLRTAPALGAASYRFSWRHDDGVWESSVAVPVAADGSQPPPV